MTPARRPRVAAGIAAIVLMLGFALVSYVLLVWEPAQGFVVLSDYSDVGKLLPALQSGMWIGLDRAYVAMAAALLVLALGLRDGAGRVVPAVVVLGAVAGLSQLLIAMLGSVCAELPQLIPDSAALEATSLTLVALRFALLKAFVFALGGFVLTVSWLAPRHGWFPRGVAALGWLTGLPCLVFWLVPLPVPVLLAPWTGAVGVSLSRRGAAK